MTRIKTRIPLIALDYVNERHKAVEKELLVDYDSGNIYVVSKDDKSVIIDITGKIKEQLENMTGDKIEVNIEGIGTVNLTEIIKKLQFDIQNTVQVIPTGEDIHYVGRENVLDEKSLEVVNKRIQLKGFSSAETHMIPRKGANGELEWINMLLVPEDRPNNPGNGGSGDIIPPGNPDDAQSLSVTILELIALDYINERHKAVEKELLVDYDNGNIYVVSKDDKSIIIDITGKIKEQLESMTGDKIEINIEGIGTVNLTEVIKKLQFDIQNSVQVVSTGEDIHYVGKENVLDEKSLEVVNKRIQLKGFSSAETHMIPRKGVNGELEWINMLLVPEDRPNNPGNGGSGDIIPPGNPDDAQSLSVTILEPVNDKIYLRASRRQKSVNVSKNCIVVIPRVLDQFCEIEWYVITNDFAPLFRFSNNILWSDVTDTQPRVNSHHVYKFKSWDAGETWIGEIVHYNKVASESFGVLVQLKLI